VEDNNSPIFNIKTKDDARDKGNADLLNPQWLSGDERNSEGRLISGMSNTFTPK